jgi:hypothetical protein
MSLSPSPVEQRGFLGSLIVLRKRLHDPILPIQPVIFQNIGPIRSLPQPGITT